MDCRIRWLLLHYPPRASAANYQNDTAPGRLPDVRQEMAARQAAVWYFSDGFVLLNESPTPLNVYTRTQEIIAAVQSLADACAPDAPDVAITDLNMDGAVQDGERGLAGWTVSVLGKESKTTNAIGNALWSLVPGTYTVVVTPKTGWLATNPVTQTVTLGQGDVIHVLFGQIKLPVVRVQVFHDADLSGHISDGDSPLSGWWVGLYRQDGSQAAGWNRATDDEGWVYFSNDPARNPPDLVPGTYYVQETLPDGWYATTGISHTFTLAAGDIYKVRLGNFPPAPALEIVVTAGDAADGTPYDIHEGAPVTYTYRFTNTGNTYLSNVYVTDDRYGSICTVLGLLAPDETVTCHFVAYPASSVTNVGTVSGLPTLANRTPLENWPTVSDTDDAVVRVFHPALTLTATGPSQAHEGDTLTYSLRVVNTGDVVLDVALPLPDGTTWEMTLEPGKSAQREVAAAVSGDPTVRPFTATGTDPLGGMAQATATVTTDILHPALTLTVTAPITATYPGSPVILTYETVNVGDILLYDVVVWSDNGTPDDSDDDFVVCTAAVLGIGESVSCTVPVAPEKETIYTATATGTDPLNGQAEDTVPIGIGIIPTEPGDLDGDGMPNYADTDTDGDGIPNAEEGLGDLDSDGIPNYLDTDSDGDGVPDWMEAGCSSPPTGNAPCPNPTQDSDRDGIPDFRDDDDDGDGIFTANEYIASSDYFCNNTTLDTDGDTTPNCRDNDVDGDGIPNYLDPDSDGDGTPDRLENYPNPNPPPFGHGDVPAWIDPVYRLYLPLVLKNH